VDLLGEARSDVVVRTRAEGVETQRLFALARHGNHDRGPFDLVRLTAGQPPVGVEQYLKMRPGIDMMPTAPGFGPVKTPIAEADAILVMFAERIHGRLP
jgi:hypothetical protein